MVTETRHIYTRVEAPPVAPHPFGLFSVAAPSTPADPHWQMGVEWRTTACLPIATTTDPCITGDAITPKVAAACDLDDGFIGIKPFAAVAFFKRSGESQDVARAEAEAALAAGEEYAAESALWDSMSTVTATAAAGPVSALGAVEAELGKGYHGTGVIHMSRFLGIALANQLVKVGSQLQTIIGTPVVVGGGYDQAATEAGPHTIYGTGSIIVRRGVVETVDAVDRALNDIYSLAERTYVVGWDCFIVGRTATVTGG
jgi:hypothetical protein